PRPGRDGRGRRRLPPTRRLCDASRSGRGDGGFRGVALAGPRSDAPGPVGFPMGPRAPGAEAAGRAAGPPGSPPGAFLVSAGPSTGPRTPTCAGERAWSGSTHQRRAVPRAGRGPRPTMAGRMLGSLSALLPGGRGAVPGSLQEEGEAVEVALEAELEDLLQIGQGVDVAAERGVPREPVGPQLLQHGRDLYRPPAGQGRAAVAPLRGDLADPQQRQPLDQAADAQVDPVRGDRVQSEAVQRLQPAL